MFKRYSGKLDENREKKLLANEVKLRSADFIRKLREGIFARQKAFEFSFLSSKVSRKVVLIVKIV